MRPLSPAGQQAIHDLAQRHGFSPAAVHCMLEAVINGNGSMAQFNHPEFGGSGQWMSGGMTMVSDLFNHALKSRVDGLCSELSSLIAQQPGLIQSGSFQSQSQGGGPGQQQASYGGGQQQNSSGGQQQQQSGTGPVGPVSLFVPPAADAAGDWWGSSLRWPNSTGAQNGVRYAYFAQARRLAIEVGGRVTIYDTLDHQIGGFSQQQGFGGSLTFSSQYGLVEVASLPVVSVDGAPPPEAPAEWAPPPAPSDGNPAPSGRSQDDLFALIERLADLRAKGILSDEEFAAKKTELLSRL
ncbi:MAG: SHOCT domain-containing protein [Candidatus Competibacteraceae bacterium]|nr:SHOCT domain-containing protein [Candidatus Competibacteraceae bacterium]